MSTSTNHLNKGGGGGGGGGGVGNFGFSVLAILGRFFLEAKCINPWTYMRINTLPPPRGTMGSG